MKTTMLVPLVFALTLGGDSDAQMKEVAKFAGTWEFSECRFDGKDFEKLKLKISFKGNEGRVEGNDDVTRQYGKIKFKLDPSTSPKIFDVTISAGSQTDATMEGIYEFKGDDLRLCLKVIGKDRPNEFAAPEGSSNVYLVLKRAP